MRDTPRRIKGVLAELVTVRPGPPHARGPVRAMLALLAPLLLLHAIDRMDLALYATLGAITSVMLGPMPYRGRWHEMVVPGLFQIGGVLVGSLVAAYTTHPGWAIPAVALVGALGARASDVQGWRVTGPFFPVFATGSAATAPIDSGEIVPAVLAVSLAALVAMILGLLEEWWYGDGLPNDLPPLIRNPPHRERIQTVRTAFAVVLAGGLATLSNTHYPSWAMTSSVVCFARPGLRMQLARGLHRGLGTLVGAAVGAAILFSEPSVTTSLILLVLLQGGAELMVPRHYGTALVFITPLALLAVHLAHSSEAGALVWSRVIETLIGVTVSIVLAIATRDRSLPPG